MKDTYYAISGYIPQDEEGVVNVSLYKLCTIGSEKNRKYIWIAINYNGGIGTATDKHNENIEDAILLIYKYMDEVWDIGKYTFEEAMNIYNDITKQLEQQLTNKK